LVVSVPSSPLIAMIRLWRNTLMLTKWNYDDDVVPTLFNWNLFRKILTMIYTTYEYGTVVSNPSNHFGWCESRWWPACGFRLAIRLQLAKRSRTQSTFMFRICPS
jgi:hypothetical protein